MSPTLERPVQMHAALADMAWEQLPPGATLEVHLVKMASILHDPEEHAELMRRARQQRPTIVCLCGSTRYHRDFMEVAALESLKGRIVLTVHSFQFVPRQDSNGKHLVFESITPEQKVHLDELHLRKIDLADEVIILNRDGYMGDSTRAELAYARTRRKHIRFLEDPGVGL